MTILFNDDSGDYINIQISSNMECGVWRRRICRDGENSPDIEPSTPA